MKLNEATSESEYTPLDGLPIMSKAELLHVALEHGGYSTPSLNDTLYLHYKGYRCIENLEEYTGLKSLWLHSNGFGKIENLSHLKELRCLFLQRNSITCIENLPASIVQLDLSENNIHVIEGLSHLVNLTTLNLSKNTLVTAASIQHLAECKSLSAVDLSHNKLAGNDIVDCIAGIEKLTSLNMSGNPVCSKVAHFRKKMIVTNKSLRYLDRPIFDNERATAEEWARAGPEAERELKEKLLAMKQQKGRNAMKEFREWQESIRSVSVENKTDTALAPDTVDLLLDVEGVNSLADVVNEEDGKQGSHDVVATKVKSLSSYVSSSGDRKTYEELLVGSSMKPAVTLSRDALSFDIVSSDDDSSSSCVYS
ncbi:hypothetical protein ACHAXM_003273 [Skeletonema potamos]